jgi:hypothetical protein
LPQFSSVLTISSISEIEEQLLTLALIKKNPLSEELSLHRLVQTEFWYYLSISERQEVFNNASMLLYAKFPRKVAGRIMFPNWGECQLYIQHVLALVMLYGSKTEDVVDLHPPVEFCKLLCHAAW